MKQAMAKVAGRIYADKDAQRPRKRWQSLRPVRRLAPAKGRARQSFDNQRSDTSREKNG
jgi:hypothetical protein